MHDAEPLGAEPQPLGGELGQDGRKGKTEHLHGGGEHDQHQQRAVASHLPHVFAQILQDRHRIAVRLGGNGAKPADDQKGDSVEHGEHEQRDIRPQPLHGAAGNDGTDQLARTHADGQQAETGDHLLGADDVVGIALPHRQINGAGTARDKGHDQQLPERERLERGQGAEHDEIGGDDRFDDAQQLLPVDPVGDGAGRHAEDEQREKVQGERDTDPRRGSRHLKHEQTNDDLLAAVSHVVAGRGSEQQAKVPVPQRRTAQDSADQRNRGDVQAEADTACRERA